MKRENQGFTLIELVIVVAVLGILAVVAVPRFINVTSEARTAVLNGLATTMKSAVALAQTKYKVVNSLAATTVDMDGTSVAVVAATGTPTAVLAGIGTAINYSAGANSGITANWSASATTSTLTYAANCLLTYDQTTGIPTVVTSGC